MIIVTLLPDPPIPIELLLLSGPTLLQLGFVAMINTTNKSNLVRKADTSISQSTIEESQGRSSRRNLGAELKQRPLGSAVYWLAQPDFFPNFGLIFQGVGQSPVERALLLQ